MNNLFLNHLKTISPEGRDSETRLFVPKDKIAEATRSKVLKALAGINPNKDYATLKKSEDKYATRQKAREAAMLRRGGADPESVRDAINDPGSYYANVPAMLARSRFVGKSIRSREDGKKSPRNPKPVSEDLTTAAREQEHHNKYTRASSTKDKKEVIRKRSSERKSDEVYGKGGKILKRKPKISDIGPLDEDFGRFLNINKPKRKPKSIFTGKNIVKSAKQIGLIGKKIGKAMATPMSNMDSMITGRNF